MIDHLDRANEQSANSLLKVLEEPPEHLIIIATAENLYDYCPHSFTFVGTPNDAAFDAEMLEFAAARDMPEAETRIALAEGSPGIASTLDLDVFRERRALLLAAFECGAGLKAFSSWVQESESFANRKSEKLDFYLKLAYGLLEDVLAVSQGQPAAVHRDIQQRVAALAQRVSFSWIERAVKSVDELAVMVRRNIQKVGALDAVIINLRNNLDTANA